MHMFPTISKTQENSFMVIVFTECPNKYVFLLSEESVSTSLELEAWEQTNPQIKTVIFKKIDNKRVMSITFITTCKRANPIWETSLVTLTKSGMSSATRNLERALYYVSQLIYLLKVTYWWEQKLHKLLNPILGM